MGVIRFIIYGNLLISLSAGSLSFGVVSYLKLGQPLYYFICVFFATLFIYNFQRIPRLNEITDQYSARHIWLSKNRKTLYLLTVLGGVGSVVSYFGLITIENDLLFLILIGIVGVFYAVKSIKGLALRDFPFIKIHLISLTWTFIIVIWPLIREAKPILDHLHLIIGFYCVMLAITIPFDIRDLSYDDPYKKTTPQILGPRWSKLVAAMLLVIGYSLFTLDNSTFLKNAFFYVSFIGFLILIIRTKKERKEMYFSGFLDGWIIFLGMMFLFSEKLHIF